VEDQYVKTNGATLHVVQDGPPDGPLVFLLHGFPEFWYGWRQQIPALVGAGYRVCAPDQRGYNLSDKPKGIATYDLDTLAADVVGLFDAARRSKVSLVGHDWGGVVAWWVALKYPHRLERLAILNAPHPVACARIIRHSPAQMRRSLYAAFFQIAWLPEFVLRRANWRTLAAGLHHSSRPGTFTDTDLEMYRGAWSQPGAITSMLNWYRATRSVLRKLKVTNPRVTAPTLLIWGAQDFALGRELVQPSVDLCDNARLELFENASHWVQHEEAERVNALLRDFLA
jgi:epoxide hydrolase 4